MTMSSKPCLLAAAILAVALGLVSCSRNEKAQPTDQAASSGGTATPPAAAASPPATTVEAQAFKLVAVNVVSDDANVRRKYLDMFHENVKKQFNNELPGTAPENGARCTNCDKTPKPDELRYMALDIPAVLAKFDAAKAATQQAAGSVQLAMTSTPQTEGPGPDCSTAICSPTPCTCIYYAPSPTTCRVKGVGPPYVWCTRP